MYNLDINFLKDRPEYAGATVPSGRGSRRGAAAAAAGGAAAGGAAVGGGMNPLAIGVLVGLLPFLAVGGYGLFLSMQKQANSDKLTEVQAQVSQLEAKEKERDAAKAKLAAAKAQIESLTGVFSNIKPWSAMSQDLRDRLPAGVQITEIAQKTIAAKVPPPAATPPPSPAPGASPPPAPTPIGKVEIQGYADDFDRVNDFLVVLQKSNFLNSEATRIAKAERMQPAQLSPVQLPGPDGERSRGGTQLRPGALPKLPPKVAFKIETELAKVSTDELLRELDRKGAVGLVSRIETLKEKGVIKP